MGNSSTYLELVDELGGELLATLELGDGSNNGVWLHISLPGRVAVRGRFPQSFVMVAAKYGLGVTADRRQTEAGVRKSQSPSRYLCFLFAL